MSNTTDPKKNNDDPKATPINESEEPTSREKQQQSDPNLTELKGFIDPNEALEPKGTDNPTS